MVTGQNMESSSKSALKPWCSLIYSELHCLGSQQQSWDTPRRGRSCQWRARGKFFLCSLCHASPRSILWSGASLRSLITEEIMGSIKQNKKISIKTEFCCFFFFFFPNSQKQLNWLLPKFFHICNNQWKQDCSDLIQHDTSSLVLNVLLL